MKVSGLDLGWNSLWKSNAHCCGLAKCLSRFHAYWLMFVVSESSPCFTRVEIPQSGVKEHSQLDVSWLAARSAGTEPIYPPADLHVFIAKPSATSIGTAIKCATLPMPESA